MSSCCRTEVHLCHCYSSSRNGTLGGHRRVINKLCMILDASHTHKSPSVCLQGQSEHGKAKFVQPPQLVWLAMNVLLTLIKPKAMAVLVEQVWPGLVDALLQESEWPSQHMWMIMGCLRTIVQVLGVQVYLKNHCGKMHKTEDVQGVVYPCSPLSYMQFKRKLQVASAIFAFHHTHDTGGFLRCYTGPLRMILPWPMLHMFRRRDTQHAPAHTILQTSLQVCAVMQH